jgi:dCTP diphosphatase
VVSPALVQQLRAFVAERNWAQFHTPANLAKSISIEAAELLECFQWNDDADIDDVRDELADVLTYCVLMADRLGLDLNEIVLAKLDESRSKYPVEKSLGTSTKYDRLQD